MTNPMREVLIEKVTANIGVGSPGERFDNAKALLARLTDRTPVETVARRREPAFKIRQGMAIGVKVTMRGKHAYEFVEKALAARKRIVGLGNFDKQGNVAFGVPEYIDFPGAKYDPAIGMFGFDVCLTLKRRGWRVAYKRRSTKIGKAHRITKDEAVEFMKSRFNAKVE
ncbi:MAG: 50S ribosomal protein L5 [Candidatus Micrarchaeota archaeon]